MTNWELMAQARQLLDSYIEKVNLKNVELLFGEEKAWGKAYMEKGKYSIDLNINLFRRHPEELEETVAHEVAHLSTYKEMGKHNHKTPFWRETMKAFGFKPRATKKTFRNQAVVGMGR